MKSTSKKGSQKSSREKQSRPAQKTRAATNNLSQLEHRVETLERQLGEAQLREEATGEILGIIASSPTDIQPVLNVVVERAARLCDATDAVIYRIDGDVLQQVAVYGPMPLGPIVRPIIRGRPSGRAVLDRKTIHVHDILAEIETESKSVGQLTGARTVLVTPLLRENDPVGVILIRRTEVRPFSEKQIKLLETFANQAVIALENVRLFQELKEALEQQTATSQILGVIASSPTDIQPVLNVVAENAARLCEAIDALIFRVDGDVLRIAAHYGQIPVPLGSTVEANPRF